MRWSFAFFHWLLTLLIAPLTSQLVQYLKIKNSHLIVGLAEVYPIALIFSFVFSIPVFCIYLVAFSILKKSKLHKNVIKAILITLATTGIILSIQLISSGVSWDIIIAYGITTFLVGIILPLRKQQASNE